MRSDGSTNAPAESLDDTQWPSVGWEERDWIPRIPPDLVSAAVCRRHAGRYRAAVVPRIAGLALRLPTEVVSLSEEASSEIARFDAELGAEVAPFSSVLLRSESASSSMIENLTSGAKAIALAELGSREKGNATEIAGNVAAMRAALALARDVGGEAILAMHAALMGDEHPDLAGRWRQEQVWIGGDSFGPHGAAFVPPHHEQVPALIDDLVAFVRRTDVPLLAQIAVAHAQFETVHPFADGNGRTGRALIHALLRGRELTRNVTVPVSAGLLADTGRYFDALTAYRSGDPGAIVSRLAEAAFSAIANGRELVVALRAVRAGWEEKVATRRGAASWRLADLLLRQPVVDAATVAAELGIEPRNAQRAIVPLVDAGVLDEFTGFRRNRMWQSREVLRELDAFAARAQRRGR